MQTPKNILENSRKKNPFSVPEGYFESFSENLMPQLPEKIRMEPERVTLWNKFKPWVYMAAMFAGIALMIELFFVIIPNDNQPDILGKNEDVPVSEIDEFYSFYEDQYADNAYEAFLLDDENLIDTSTKAVNSNNN